MRNFRFIIGLMLMLGFSARAQTVALVAESKRNLCLVNHEVINATVSSFSPAVTFKSFATQKICPAHYANPDFVELLFVDNHHKKLFIMSPVFSFTTPQYNTGNVLWSSPFYGFGNAAVADLNANGNPDVVSSNNKGDVYLHRNVALLIHATDSIQSTLGIGGRNARVYLTNLDNNNLPDLVTIGAYTISPLGYKYSVYKNVSSTSNLSFTPVYTGYMAATTNIMNDNFSATSFDFNNDGKDEIYFVSEATSNSLTIAYSLPSNLTQTMVLSTNVGGFIGKKVMAGDFNKDGQKDLAVLGVIPSSTASFVYIATPSFTAGIPMGIVQQSLVAMPNIIANDMAFADLNQDSLRDLIVNVVNTGSVHIYMQNRVGPSTNFALLPTVFSQSLHISGGIAAFDVDNNKMNDIISFNTMGVGNNPDTSSISIIKNFTYRDTLYATPTKSTLCPGETLKLTNDLKSFTTFGYYSPYSPSVPVLAPSHTITISTPGFYSSSATYSTFLTFPVSASSCIVNSNTIQITAGLIPTVSISGPSSVCYGSTVSLSANQAGVNSYTWSTGDVNQPTIIISPLTATDYSVFANSIDGCKSNATASVSVVPDYTTTVSTSKPGLCNNEKATLTATGGQTYTWSTGQTIPSIVVTQTSTSSQLYTVVVNNGTGCLKTNTIQTLYSNLCTDIIIKNAVTPNGDGDNDFFYIENIDKYVNNHVSIFNRWGAELYTANGYDNSTKVWPNINTGKLTAGTYYYVIDLGNGDPVQKGWIEILSN